MSKTSKKSCNMKKLAISGLLFALFFVMIGLLKTVDVAVVGEGGKAVGLSSINAAFHAWTGVHWSLYKLTDLLGFAAIGSGGIFAVVGLLQLISRKNLWKVDCNLLLFGVICILLGVFYFGFEVYIVNYRPVILPGETEVEASFPSSHTALTMAIFGGLAMLIPDYIKTESVLRPLRIILIALSVLAPVGRLLCGAHWLTDVVASLLLAGAFLCAYSALRE